MQPIPALAIVVAILLYGTISGAVWLRFGYIPRWYGIFLLVVALVIGIPLFWLSQIQL